MQHNSSYIGLQEQKIKTSDSMNGFCTTQIDQVFFVVHLRTKVIPTRINISQHLYHPISQDKLICIEIVDIMKICGPKNPPI